MRLEAVTAATAAVTRWGKTCKKAVPPMPAHCDAPRLEVLRPAVLQLKYCVRQYFK